MDFKLNKDCSQCTVYKKDCKGYKFSVKIESFYCPRYKEKKDNKGNK